MSLDDIPEIKMILLGESAVGKTSIIKRFYEDKFYESEASTYTMSYIDKIVEIDKKKYKLNIWDTIGQENYRSISKLFLNDAKIVLLVYGIDDKNSFTALEYWYNLYKEELEGQAILAIAGNKIDKYAEQEVSREEGQKFANDKKAFFAEVSAKENGEIINIFILDLIKAYLGKKNGSLGREYTSFNLRDNNNTKKEGGCCSSKKENR